MCKLRDVLKKHIGENKMFDTIEYFKDNQIEYLHPTNKYCFFINISNKNMIGGDEYTLYLKINKIKYQVNIDEYSDMEYAQTNNNLFANDKKYKKINVNDINIIENHNKKTINFIKFNSIKDERGDYLESDHCAVLIIDFEKEASTIQSLNNYDDCVRCLSKDNIFFKTGDILTQIMIIMSIKNNLKKIYLTDNSYLPCFDSKIDLIHLRTMTKGMPFYSKYGFVSVYENDVFIHNLNIWRQKKTLTKEQIIEYLNYRVFKPNVQNYINNILIPRLNKKNLISSFIDSIINDNSKESCYLLYNIYMKIYNDIGYHMYTYKGFALDLEMNSLISTNHKR